MESVWGAGQRPRSEASIKRGQLKYINAMPTSGNGWWGFLIGAFQRTHRLFMGQITSIWSLPCQRVPFWALNTPPLLTPHPTQEESEVPYEWRGRSKIKGWWNSTKINSTFLSTAGFSAAVWSWGRREDLNLMRDWWFYIGLACTFYSLKNDTTHCWELAGKAVESSSNYRREQFDRLSQKEHLGRRKSCFMFVPV